METETFFTTPDLNTLTDDADLFQGSLTEVSNLQAYYMSQFNLELECGSKNKSINHTDTYDFPNTNLGCEQGWSFEPTTSTAGCENNLTIDLDSIGFDTRTKHADSDTALENIFLSQDSIYEEENNLVFTDEEDLVIDELCRENETMPDIFNENFFQDFPVDENTLPSIDKVFNKCYDKCYSSRDASIPREGFNMCNNLDIAPPNKHYLTINNLDNYCYPNNILANLTSREESSSVTPVTEHQFSFDESRRKVSVSESIESDLQSYNDGSMDDEDLFYSLDDLTFDFEIDGVENDSTTLTSEDQNKDAIIDELVCEWENCLEKYSTQITLVDHIEREHVNTYRGEEFSCLWRGCVRGRRPFNARYKLLIHMRVHSGHKPNRCHHPGCGKAFSRLENLKIHMRSHTGERPYACPAPHCRKAFSNSSDRAKHQRTHFNARPYACGTAGCGKRYTDPSSLRKHVKSHPHAITCVDKPPPAPAHRLQPPAHTTSPAKLHTIRSIRNKLAGDRVTSKLRF